MRELMAHTKTNKKKKSLKMNHQQPRAVFMMSLINSRETQNLINEIESLFSTFHPFFITFSLFS